MKKYKNGNIVKCEVTGITDYGVFVKIDEVYNGLLHISEVSNKFVKDLDKTFIVGEIIDAKIIEIDEEKKQIKLSIKDDNKKYDKKSIIEKGSGFKPLKENLDIWVEDRLKDLQK